MQIRPKTYLHFISLWRSLRDAVSPHRSGVPAKGPAPFLIFAAVVLALVLAILEVDRHRRELKSLGFLGTDYPIQTVFLSP